MAAILYRETSAQILTPTAPGAPVVTGFGMVLGWLTCYPGQWTNDPTSYAFQWQGATTAGGTFTNLTGISTGSWHRLTAAEAGLYIRCQVTTTNAAGGSSVTQTSNVFGPISAQIAGLTIQQATPLPQVLVAIDFSGSYGGKPVWTDLTPRVRGTISIRHGRAQTLEAVQAGSLTVTLDNTDRALEPEYAASSYYPNVTPLRRIRVQLVTGGPPNTLFTGYIQQWPPTWPDHRREQVTLTAYDGMEPTSRAGFNSSRTVASGLSGTVISALLAIAGPFSTASIDAGEETVQGYAPDPTSGEVQYVLTDVQEAADSEAGIFFFNGAGQPVFHDRDHRITNGRSTTVQYTFGDAGPASAELPYTQLPTEYDATRIFNDVQVTSGLTGPGEPTPYHRLDDGQPRPGYDAPSVATYGQRTLQRSTTLLSDGAAYDQAQRILNDAKLPRLRVPSIVVDPLRQSAGNTNVWPAILSLEISDRIRIRRRPYAGGAMIEREVWIESVQHDITPGARQWQTTYQLSLADATAYWRYDTSAFDTGTVFR